MRAMARTHHLDRWQATLHVRPSQAAVPPLTPPPSFPRLPSPPPSLLAACVFVFPLPGQSDPNMNQMLTAMQDPEYKAKVEDALKVQ